LVVAWTDSGSSGYVAVATSTWWWWLSTFFYSIEKQQQQQQQQQHWLKIEKTHLNTFHFHRVFFNLISFFTLPHLLDFVVQTLKKLSEDAYI